MVCCVIEFIYNRTFFLIPLPNHFITFIIKVIVFFDFKKVILPPGEWKADDGKVYAGGQTVEINVPLERIPYFTLVEN